MSFIIGAGIASKGSGFCPQIKGESRAHDWRSRRCGGIVA